SPNPFFGTAATLTLADSTVLANQAMGGDGDFGGDGLGGGIFNGNTAPGAAPILTMTKSYVISNRAEGGKGGAAASDGQGVGGGVYDLGTFIFDVATRIKKNHASTHCDNIFSLETLKEPALGPPHPPFGHLLPGGEKGTVVALAQGIRPGRVVPRSPSPQR